MVRQLIAIAALVLATGAAASAQGVAPNIPNQATNPGMQATPQQVRDALWIRALQSRSGRNGGGVRTGVPQFVPFGNMMGMPPMFPTQPAPEADKAASKKAASRKADFEAARAERKKKSQERAEKRKAEAAARRAAS